MEIPQRVGEVIDKPLEMEARKLLVDMAWHILELSELQAVYCSMLEEYMSRDQIEHEVKERLNKIKEGK